MADEGTIYSVIDAPDYSRSSLIKLEPRASMQRFVGISDHFAPEPGYSFSTMFIRIAMSGTERPGIALLAHAPLPDTSPPLLDPDVNIDEQHRVALFDPQRPEVVVAHVTFVRPYTHNLYLLRVVRYFDDTKIWIRLKNPTAEPRYFTWVAANTSGGSCLPWLHMEYPKMHFHAQFDARHSAALTVFNRGTGTLSVHGVAPQLASALGEVHMSSPSHVAIDIPPNGSADAVKATFFASHVRGNEQMSAHLLSNDPGPFGEARSDNVFYAEFDVRPPAHSPTYPIP